MQYKFRSTSEEATADLGRELAAVLSAGDIVALDGDLGAGKTVFTKGFCDGAGVTSHVSSPTFNIVNEYQGGKVPVYHFDTYRLEGPDDFLDSGLDEYFDYEGICIIEWSSIIGDLLPGNAIRMFIRGVGNERDIEVVFDEDKFEEDKLSKLKAIFGRGDR